MFICIYRLNYFHLHFFLSASRFPFPKWCVMFFSFLFWISDDICNNHSLPFRVFLCFDKLSCTNTFTLAQWQWQRSAFEKSGTTSLHCVDKGSELEWPGNLQVWALPGCSSEAPTFGGRLQTFRESNDLFWSHPIFDGLLFELGYISYKCSTNKKKQRFLFTSRFREWTPSSITTGITIACS